MINPTSKGSNLHCIGAVSATRVIKFNHRRGSYKANDCVDWFRELIQMCQNEGIIRPTFIIDNAPAHARVETAVDPGIDVEILRLAPYSYLLNPIELVWSSFKASVKRQLQDAMPEILAYAPIQGLTISEQRMRKLEAISDNAIQSVTQENLIQYANRVEIYYPAAIRQADIFEEH